MGLLNTLFSGNVSNPMLVNAVEKYVSDPCDDNLVDLWQKFLKSRVILAVSAEAAKSFAKIKHIREAMGLTCNTTSNDKGDHLLVVFTDTQSFKSVLSEPIQAITVTGDQAYQLVIGKGLFGLVVNPKTNNTCELKVWQHQIFIERVNDANKLHALAAKLARSANHADAECILKAALLAAQQDPGPSHPFSAELNIELARVHRAQGKLNEAEWTLKRALAIYEQLSMRELDVASTAEELGTMLFEADKPEAAAGYLQKALAVYEQVPGGKTESISRIMCQLADSLVKEKRLAEAEQLYTRAAVLLEERKHPDLLSVLVKLGRLVEQSGRSNEALAHYMRAVTGYDSIKRCRKLDLGQAAHGAAVLQLGMRRIAEARAMAQKALPAYRKDGTDEDVQTVELLLAQIDEAETKLGSEPPPPPQPVEEPSLETSGDRKAALQRSIFNRDRKNAADLPFLDMDELKSRPKTRPSPPEMPALPVEEKSIDPEEEALKQMCAFLDSLNKTDQPKAAAVAEQSQQAQPQLDEKGIDEAFVAAIDSVMQPASASETAQPPVVPEIAPASENPPASVATITEAPASIPSAPPTAETAVTVPPPPPPPAETAAPVPPPPPPATVPVEPTTVAAAAAAGQASEVINSVAENAPLQTIGAEHELGQVLAADISAVFSQSVLGGLNKHDRFDKPISERLKMGQPAAPNTSAAQPPAAVGSSAQQPQPVEPAPQPKAADTDGNQQKLFQSPVDSEISQIFNGAMLKDLMKSDRFNQPVESRISKASPGAANQPAAQSAIAGGYPVAQPPPAAPAIETPPAAASASAQIEPSAPPAIPPSPPPAQTPPAAAAPADAAVKEYEDVRAMSMLGQLKQRITSAKLQLSQAEKKVEGTTDTPEAGNGGNHANSQQAAQASPATNEEIVARVANPLASTQCFTLPVAELADLNAQAASASSAASQSSSGEQPAARSASEMLYLVNAKLQHEPHNPDLLMRKGTLLAQLERIDEAIKVFDKLTTIQPNDARVWYCKGSSLHLKNDFEDALYCFNHVLNLDGMHRKAMLRKAECLLHLGRTDQGLMLYDRLLSFDPKFIPGWLSKARALLKQGRFADALACYEQVLQIDPGNEQAMAAKNLIDTKLGTNL